MIFVGASGNDPKNDFIVFLKNYVWLICVIVIVLIAISVLAIILTSKNKKKPHQKEISKAAPIEWIDALGGKENIEQINSSGSRLVVNLNNPEKINRELLTKLGINNIVLMSNKITLISNLNNRQIEEEMKKYLQN